MSNVPRVHERLVAEQAAAKIPDDAPAISHLRWALLHGEAFTAQEAAARFNFGTTTLAMVGADLERAGFVLEREKVEGHQVRIRITNLAHRPQPFESKGTLATKAKKAAAAAAPNGIKAGTLTARIGARLRAAFPDSVPLPAGKPTWSALHNLRKHGWVIESEGRDSRFRLVSTPEGPAPANPDGKPLPVEVIPKPRAQRKSDANGLLTAPAPATPPLGTAVRVTMVAEDNGTAVIVLADAAGTRWFARLEGSEVAR